jgi:hypothetical protein
MLISHIYTYRIFLLILTLTYIISRYLDKLYWNLDKEILNLY